LCLIEKYCTPVKINMPLIIYQPFLNISPVGIIIRELIKHIPNYFRTKR
jgi:hypothetical protein